MIQLNFDIKRHKLKNGLEVLTIHKDTQIAAINVGIKIGALYEKMNTIKIDTTYKELKEVVSEINKVIKKV